MHRASVRLILLFCLLPLVAPAQIQYPNPIKHVVLIVQENRTPDNLFHGLLARSSAGGKSKYDLASSGLALINGTQQVVPLTPVALATDFDPDHGHSSFVAMYDDGKMDGANLVGDSCGKNAPDCTNNGKGQLLSYKFVVSSDVAPYLQMARQYGWANYMFQTNQGASFAAHQMLFSGTSARNAENDAAGLFVSGNPVPLKDDDYHAPEDTGCLAPLGEVIYWISVESAPQQFPTSNDPLGNICFDHDTAATLLDSAGLSWKYYASASSRNPYPSDPKKHGYNPQGYMLTAPNTWYALCLPDYDSGDPECTNPRWTTNIDLNPSDVLTDIGNCNLATVSWVTPIGRNSDHPGSLAGGKGPSWVASIVNAIGNDKTCEQGAGYWSDTAILITWDDWGGWYDHVAPTILPGSQGDYEYGFRVPFLLISAYTPPGYVDDNRLDFGSILRFVQGVFNIPEGSLGFADARATNDLNGFFNFGQQPRAFQTIPAPLDAHFFIHDSSPPDPPDSD